MAYTAKNWLNFPNKTTPINRTALQAMEQRGVSFCASEATPPGTGGWEDFRPKQNPSGATMQIGIGLATTEMNVWVRGTDSGVYRYQYNGAQLLATIPAADPSNPRIDRVCATAPTSSDSIVPQIIVLAGTPTGGATLDNLSGAQSVPSGFELLGDVLTGAGVTSIVTANIRDRRRMGGIDGNSSLLVAGSVQSSAPSQRDEAYLLPSQALIVAAQSLTPATHDNMQGAYVAYLSRRIVAATRFRWRYAQGATPATSNWIGAIFDQSGRLIIATAATAFAGGASSINTVAATIGATTFEPGFYLVFLGVAALTGASAVSFTGVQGNVSTAFPGVSQTNTKVHSATGGTTVPTTLGAFTDTATQAAAANNLPLPVVSLSVG